MKSHQDPSSITALTPIQQYLFDHAEALIDFFSNLASQHEDTSSMFESMGGDRVVLQKERDLNLITILSDPKLQADFDKRVCAWKLIVSDSAIQATRQAIRAYYFHPMTIHPKWKAFLSLHSTITPSVINQIAGTFSYWLLKIWLDEHVTETKRIQPLVKILNGGESDAETRKTFEKDLATSLQDEFSGFFLDFVNFSGSKSSISSTVASKLQMLQDSEMLAPFDNGQLILWKRICNFACQGMVVAVTQLTKEEKDKNEEIKKTVVHEIRPEIKKEIAKGIANFLNDIPKEKFTLEKNFLTLSMIIQEIEPLASKQIRAQFKSVMQFPKDKRDQYRAHPEPFSKTSSALFSSSRKTRDSYNLEEISLALFIPSAPILQASEFKEKTSPAEIKRIKPKRKFTPSESIFSSEESPSKEDDAEKPSRKISQ